LKPRGGSVDLGTGDKRAECGIDNSGVGGGGIQGRNGNPEAAKKKR